MLTLFIQLFIFKSVWTRIYFILVVIICYYLFSCSNCPTFGHYKFLQLDSCVLSTCPIPPFFWVLPYFLFTVFLNTNERNYINSQLFFCFLDCFGCIGWASCFSISFEDSRMEEAHWESHDWLTGIISAVFK